MKNEAIKKHLEIYGNINIEVGCILSNYDNIIRRLVNSEQELLRFCQQYDGQGNIYIGVNERSKIDAIKTDIHAVNFVVVDIDAVRPDSKNQPSNQQELDTTIEVSKMIVDWFSDNGFCLSVRAISGNGCHIWARIPRLELTGLEMTKDWESRVKQFYLQIKSVLTSDLKQKVKIDSIQDVTRIMKLIGTTSVKANPTVDRPNRVSFWLDDPGLLVADAKLFAYVESLTPEIKIKSAPTLHLESEGLAAIAKPI